MSRVHGFVQEFPVFCIFVALAFGFVVGVFTFGFVSVHFGFVRTADAVNTPDSVVPVAVSVCDPVVPTASSVVVLVPVGHVPTAGVSPVNGLVGSPVVNPVAMVA